MVCAGSQLDAGLSGAGRLHRRADPNAADAIPHRRRLAALSPFSHREKSSLSLRERSRFVESTLKAFPFAERKATIFRGAKGRPPLSSLANEASPMLLWLPTINATLNGI